MDSFADYIRFARQKADLSQVELADRLGISQAAVSRLETGRSTPGISDLVEIESALPGFDAAVASAILTAQARRTA